MPTGSFWRSAIGSLTSSRERRGACAKSRASEEKPFIAYQPPCSGHRPALEGAHGRFVDCNRLGRDRLVALRSRVALSEAGQASPTAVCFQGSESCQSHIKRLCVEPVVLLTSKRLVPCLSQVPFDTSPRSQPWGRCDLSSERCNAQSKRQSSSISAR